jgi:outer membrane protein
MLNKLLIILLGSFISLSSAYAGKVGYVDMQKAVEMTKTGKKAIDKLKDIQNKKQKELDGRKTALEKEQKEIQKKFAVYSKEKQMQVQQDFQKKAMDADKYFRESQVELAKKEKELLEPIFEGLREAIERYAKKNDYDMIFEKNRSSVLYGTDKSDLTANVVKTYGQ